MGSDPEGELFNLGNALHGLSGSFLEKIIANYAEVRNKS